MSHEALHGSEGFNESPSQADLDMLREIRKKMVDEALKGAHDLYHGALTLDAQNGQLATMQGALANSAEIRRFVTWHDNHAVLPVPYHEIKWRPKPHRAATAMIQNWTMRLPLFREDDAVTRLAAAAESFAVTEPNDVVIGVNYRNGESYAYLFNGRGIEAARGWEDLVVMNYDPNQGEDGLAIINDDPLAPALSSAHFQNLVKDSLMQQRSMSYPEK